MGIIPKEFETIFSIFLIFILFGLIFFVLNLILFAKSLTIHKKEFTIALLFSTSKSKSKNEIKCRSIRKRNFFLWWSVLFLLTIFCLIFCLLLIPPQFEATYLTNASEKGNVSKSLRQVSIETGKYFGGLLRIEETCDSHLLNLEYSSVTPENFLKWSHLSSDGSCTEYDWKNADKMIKQATNDYHLRVRGHTLIWDTRWRTFYPKRLQEKFQNKSPQVSVSEAKELLKNHICTVMQHYKDHVHTWDVINEPMNSEGGIGSEGNLFQKILGHKYIHYSLQYARECSQESNNVTTTLFINEAFVDYSLDSPKVKGFLSLLKNLTQSNVPLDGVGIQGHAMYQLQNNNNIRDFMSQIDQLGLKFEITELDSRLRLFTREKKSSTSDPYQLQADYYRDWVNGCFHFANCQGITFWGVSDATSWYDSFMMFRWLRPNKPYIFDYRGRRKQGWHSLFDAFSNLPTNPNSTIAPFAPSSKDFTKTEQFSSCSGKYSTQTRGKYLPLIIGLLSLLLFILLITSILLFFKKSKKTIKINPEPNENQNLIQK
ncbi:endo-14-beta-xylanase [Anaeramoeba flamelloides]|uniref:endo-1,4-beta-xylanase n=1 Tax=Anaeramoeba flamelloides TaxID=1746091 RepID=A0AAV7Y9E4_9EUKA|nr:endo-14-beta-xylanase [Anaeramoeba flamelloides]